MSSHCKEAATYTHTHILNCYAFSLWFFGFPEVINIFSIWYLKHGFSFSFSQQNRPWNHSAKILPFLSRSGCKAQEFGSPEDNAGRPGDVLKVAHELERRAQLDVSLARSDDSSPGLWKKKKERTNQARDRKSFHFHVCVWPPKSERREERLTDVCVGPYFSTMWLERGHAFSVLFLLPGVS